MSEDDRLSAVLMEVVEGLGADKRKELPGTGGLRLWLEVESVQEGYVNRRLERGDLEIVHLMVVQGKYDVLAGAFSGAYTAGATKDAKVMAEAKKAAVYHLVHGRFMGYPGLAETLVGRAEKARERLSGLETQMADAIRDIPEAQKELAAASYLALWVESLTKEAEAPSV